MQNFLKNAIKYMAYIKYMRGYAMQKYANFHMCELEIA